MMVFVFIFALAACSTAQPAQPATPTDDGSHLLIDVQGTVNVKRVGRSEYVPGMFGMVLHRGDLLKLEGNAQARVACADLTLANASSGANSVPCGAAQAVIADPSTGSRVTAARSNIPADIPIILSPRRTRLLTPRPLIRWTPISGVDSYQVSIQQKDIVWSTTVNGKAEIRYPDSATALTPGQTYKVIVVAGGRSSEDKLVPDLGFTIATPDEVQEVRSVETRIKSLGLKDGPTEFLRAVLYATHKSETRDNFNAEAIDHLEQLSSSLKQPAVLRMLGDLYLKVGLLSMAEESFRQANDLSRTLNDVEGQATELQTLGMIYELLGNKAEAVKHLQDAIAWYQKIGDATTVSQLQEQLNKLKNP
jgi:hypothetical protein